MKPLLTSMLLGLLVLLAACKKEPADLFFEPFSWQDSTPEQQGMDGRMLDSAMVLASGYGFVDGLLVIRNSNIVAEAYYNGFTADIPHNIMSVSKSMLSAIAGLVLEGPYGLDLEESMRYNTFITHLLSGVISKATGQDTDMGASLSLYSLI